MNYQTKRLDPTKQEDMATAVALLQQGELVAVPTETVYGLAADARNVTAVQKIFIAKNRPADHPLIVHVASFDNLSEWAQNIPATATLLAQKFWPGPLTILLEKAPWVNNVVTGGLPTIALRVPQHPVFLELLRTLDTGLAAPSANPHKRISPTKAEHVLDTLGGKIPAVLDGGPCHFGLESTIIDLTKSVPAILRPGPITQAMLEEVLKTPVKMFAAHSEKVAGNMLVHYQPHTRTKLMDKEAIIDYLALPENSSKKFGLMIYSSIILNHNSVIIEQLPQDKSAYAALLYQALHSLDAAEVDEILVETPPHSAEWSDVSDRLTKATSKY